MIKITDCIKDILMGDDIAREALKLNYLNLSAYAKQIRPEIEAKLYKPVSTGAMVVALSRVRGDFLTHPDYRPQVHIENMSICPNLAELTYEKTNDTLAAVGTLDNVITRGDTFFAITQGSAELTLIFDAKNITKVLTHLMRKPKGQYSNLTAITVRFEEERYIEVPNMIFSLVSVLAVKRINLIEIVSTFTELSFIVRSKDTQRTVEVLSPYLGMVY